MIWGWSKLAHSASNFSLSKVLEGRETGRTLREVRHSRIW
jgi:hypothetical protein